jgi:hypothetical protein
VSLVEQRYSSKMKNQLLLSVIVIHFCFDIHLKKHIKLQDYCKLLKKEFFLLQTLKDRYLKFTKERHMVAKRFCTDRVMFS